ncbi:MAG: amidohydrolase [Clostridia bacterium]|nr:amidohydrolase [Clostridia bacterium]
MIIDIHTHIFPDKLAERAIKVLEDNILKVSKREEKAKLDGKLQSLMDSMKKNDITVSAVMPIATNPSQTDTINAFASEINGKGNVYSFGSVHPNDEKACEHLEKIKELGLKGIKLHPEYQSFYIDSKESLRVLEKAEELGLYVMLHAGADIGMAPPVHCEPEQLKNALNYVSGKNIIAAHMGGYMRWEKVLKYLVDTPIYFDTSYSVGQMDDELAKEIIKAHGADKILFGSDSPWMDQGYVAEKIREFNLGEEAQRKIFWENGAKIFDILEG